MHIISARDFFYKNISVTSALMPEEFKLTPRELDFLVECCMYNHDGKDLSNTKALSEHMLYIKFFKRKTDISLYKYKLGTKKWARTGRDTFKLPNHLDKLKGDLLKFELKFKWIDENIPD